VKIGNGVIIGADSVVSNDCEDYGLYVGNTAKINRILRVSIHF
jgi:acetyltransferase-like isoleucine patch superfamily enzyme